MWEYQNAWDTDEEVLNEWYENTETGECISVDEYKERTEFEPGTITVVNRKDLPERTPNTILFAIDRPNPLGNPFRIGRDGTRLEVIQKYKAWLHIEFCKNPHNPHLTPLDHEMMQIHKAYLEWKDIQLVCNCAPAPCHGEVIKEMIENL